MNQVLGSERILVTCAFTNDTRSFKIRTSKLSAFYSFKHLLQNDTETKICHSLSENAYLNLAMFIWKMFLSLHHHDKAQINVLKRETIKCLQLYLMNGRFADLDTLDRR